MTAPGGIAPMPVGVEPTPDYAEIGVTTNFSFLRGASHPQEYVHRAGEYRLRAIGIADRLVNEWSGAHTSTSSSV